LCTQNILLFCPSLKNVFNSEMWVKMISILIIRTLKLNMLILNFEIIKDNYNDKCFRLKWNIITLTINETIVALFNITLICLFLFKI